MGDTVYEGTIEGYIRMSIERHYTLKISILRIIILCKYIIKLWLVMQYNLL